MSLIPYANGGPRYWRDEQSGRLQSAIYAYFGLNADHEMIEVKPLSQRHIWLIREYLIHWADAPCFKQNLHATVSDLVYQEMLVRTAEKIQSRADIDSWLELAIEHGIDPM